MLYINGRPVNPIVSFLMSALVLAGVVMLGILLLPLIGGILLFVLFVGLAVVLYGAYLRWRHGDPIKKMQEEAVKAMQSRAWASGAQSDTAAQSVRRTDEAVRGNEVRTGVRRTTTVEDVEVVEEIRRRDVK
ncbi:MAG: hypothetical protein ACI4SV_01800 [Duodenibacillus sp.]